MHVAWDAAAGRGVATKCRRPRTRRSEPEAVKVEAPGRLRRRQRGRWKLDGGASGWGLWRAAEALALAVGQPDVSPKPALAARLGQAALRRRIFLGFPPAAIGASP